MNDSVHSLLQQVGIDITYIRLEVRQGGVMVVVMLVAVLLQRIAAGNKLLDYGHPTRETNNAWSRLVNNYLPFSLERNANRAILARSTLTSTFISPS